MAKRGRPRKTRDDSAAQTIENISDDQLQALFFQSKRDYEKNLATKKKADADFKNCCKRIKAELGKRGVAEIKLAVLLDTESGEADAKADIESMLRVMRWKGVAIGTQADLFPDNDPTPITDRAFAEGRRHGLAGKRDNPHHHTTEAARSYEAGFAEGQHALATGGFKPLDDDAPSGALPKDEWARQTREQNEKVQKAIKSDTIDSLTQN
jgi:hypothetical protein